MTDIPGYRVKKNEILNNYLKKLLVNQLYLEDNYLPELKEANERLVECETKLYFWVNNLLEEPLNFEEEKYVFFIDLENDVLKVLKHPEDLSQILSGDPNDNPELTEAGEREVIATLKINDRWRDYAYDFVAACEVYNEAYQTIVEYELEHIIPYRDKVIELLNNRKLFKRGERFIPEKQHVVFYIHQTGDEYEFSLYCVDKQDLDKLPNPELMFVLL